MKKVYNLLALTEMIRQMRKHHQSIEKIKISDLKTEFRNGNKTELISKQKINISFQIFCKPFNDYGLNKGREALFVPPYIRFYFPVQHRARHFSMEKHIEK